MYHASRWLQDLRTKLHAAHSYAYPICIITIRSYWRSSVMSRLNEFSIIDAFGQNSVALQWIFAFDATYFTPQVRDWVFCVSHFAHARITELWISCKFPMVDFNNSRSAFLHLDLFKCSLFAFIWTEHRNRFARNSTAQCHIQNGRLFLMTNFLEIDFLLSEKDFANQISLNG